MIDFLVFHTAINIFEALRIREDLNMEMKKTVVDGKEKDSTREASTKKYRSSGIAKIGVWINPNMILGNPNGSNHRLIITTTLKNIAYIYVSEPTVYQIQTIDYIVVLTDGQEFLINPIVHHELQEIIAGGPLC